MWVLGNKTAPGTTSPVSWLTGGLTKSQPDARASVSRLATWQKSSPSKLLNGPQAGWRDTHCAAHYWGVSVMSSNEIE
jgi:hypothetical protein